MRRATSAGHGLAQRAHADPVQAILDAEDGRLLFRGKVSDIARRTAEGFLRGEAAFDGLDAALVGAALARTAAMLEEAVDRMKTDAAPVPPLAVGGGAFLVPDGLPGCSEVLPFGRGAFNAQRFLKPSQVEPRRGMGEVEGGVQRKRLVGVHRQHGRAAQDAALAADPGGVQIVRPPSTGNSTPVMKSASSEAR